MDKLNKGFTLIEFLIVATLIIIVAVMTALGFGQMRTNTQHITQAQNLATIISEARTNAIGGVDNVQWGVHFEVDSYTLFSGSSYDPLDPDNSVYNFPSGVTISSTVLSGGGAETIFKRINGGTDQYGTVTVSTDSRSALLTIQEGGEVSVDGIAPVPLDTRVVDTRHVHFTLPWSIHAASTLTLTFLDPPNPPVVQDIDMEPYFTGGNTVFNWSGAYTVGGSEQVLKIHTHLIDPVANSTILSVHRDKMDNTKALNVSIDATTVASYATEGAVTPGTGVTSEEQ